MLATLGVVLSACVTATGMHYLAHWQWLSALVFGALIAATDPVSVIATFKEAKAQGRLLVLIEAESLFNDGTAAVVFGVVVALASGQQLTSLEITAMLLKTIGGGILCGAAVALGALLLLGRTDDHLVEITFTTVAAYGSFLLADHFGLSGVLATITAGLVMGNFKSLGTISDRGRGGSPGILGIRRLRRELAGLPSDRNARSPSKFRGDMASGGEGDCTGDAGPGGSDLSLLPYLFTLLASRDDETPTCPVLGRLARGIGASSCPWTSP